MDGAEDSKETVDGRSRILLDIMVVKKSGRASQNG